MTINKDLLPAIDWTAQSLGIDSDSAIARRVGCSPPTVAEARKMRDIRLSKTTRHNLRKTTNWDAQRLGVDTDTAIAKRLGVSNNIVRDERKKRNIPAPKRRVSVLDHQAFLEEPDDQALADRIGVNVRNIRHRRQRLGIVKSTHNTCPVNIDWDAQPFGKEPDREIARRLKVPVHYVNYQRKKRGISPRAGCGVKRDAAWWDAQPLGKTRDKDLAALIGVTVAAIKVERKKRGIPPYLRSIDWDKQPLGKMPDTALAKILDVSQAVVWNERVKRGIPVFDRKRK